MASACGTASCKLTDEESRATDSLTRSKDKQRLIIALALSLLFAGAEVAGGLISHSLAILTDAAHLLSDVAGFAISLFSIWAAGWDATPRRSYGYFRLEILGALLSIQLIWLLTGILIYEAIHRMTDGYAQSIDGRLMFITASFGFAVNLVMVILLQHHDHGHSHHGHHAKDGHSDKAVHGLQKPAPAESSRGHADEQMHRKANDARSNARTTSTELDGSESGHVPPLNISLDVPGASSVRPTTTKGSINVRGAWLHVFGDLVQSFGVMVGGAIIWRKPHWRVVDLSCTLLFSLLVLGTTGKMLRDIVDVLMESTPREIDVEKVQSGICELPGVIAMHDLHVWSITMGKTLLACHLTIDPDADPGAILQHVLGYCDKRLNISHVTVQIEKHSANQ